MYRDTTNNITVERSETDSTVTKEMENETMDEKKTPDGMKENELLGFISWEYFILYLIYFISFGIGSFTPHAVQLWMDFTLCLFFSIVCYIYESISNQWIGFLFFAFSHSLIHYIYPFLDDNGDFVDGISVFPDTLCHALMFIYSVWFLGFGNLYDFIHFSRWKISIYFKIFWIICISGSLIHIVASLLVHVGDEIIHYKQTVLILRYSSIFPTLSTAFFCSAAMVNPLNCKSRKMIEYHLILWLIIGIICGSLWAFYLVIDMKIVIDHGWIQILFIYAVIASLCIHFYHHFISNKQF